jgi:hypothetical protein
MLFTYHAQSRRVIKDLTVCIACIARSTLICGSTN